MSLRSPWGLVAVGALSLIGACSDGGSGRPSGGAGTTGVAGSTPTGTAGSGAAGDTQPAGTAGNVGAAGATGAAGNVGVAGTTGTAGSTGAAGTPGSAGTMGTAGVTGAGGSDPPPPRPINIVGTGLGIKNLNGMQVYFSRDKKPTMGKLVLLLGGICTGPGAGGFESFVQLYGFHIMWPKTDMCLTGGKVPQMYKDTLKTNPTDPEANRQVADARMELWDAKDRVSWYTAPTPSIQDQVIGALKMGAEMDPGSDWGYFLNADGTLRTTDVYVVGYSWGSQTWSMISSYVRFGKVIATSGPVSEGFPDAEWITHPSPNGTPVDRKYCLDGLQGDYPGTTSDIITNVLKAGWLGPVTNVHPDGTGTYTNQRIFDMVGSNNASPGGHTVFCNDNPANGWIPLCKYVLGVQ